MRKLIFPVDLKVITCVADVGVNIKDGFQYDISSEFIFYEIVIFGASLPFDFDLVCGLCVDNSVQELIPI